MSTHAGPDVPPSVLDQPGARCGLAGGALFVGAAVCTALPLTLALADLARPAVYAATAVLVAGAE